jgi:ATP-binding cassette subfamily C (CFTR/MRP) protein 1
MANAIIVERVTEYSKIEPEAKEVLTERRPPQDWPQSGAVEFKDYNVRYREGLPLTLKNINLDIKAGERVGIVGRTGAGKSTLTLAL